MLVLIPFLVLAVTAGVDGVLVILMAFMVAGLAVLTRGSTRRLRRGGAAAEPVSDRAGPGPGLRFSAAWVPRLQRPSQVTVKPGSQPGTQPGTRLVVAATWDAG